jgi:hypothetical protein
MNRRTLIRWAILVPVTSLVSPVAAQRATPEPGAGQKTVPMYSNLHGIERVVYSYATQPSFDQGSWFDGSLAAVDAWAFEFEQERHAEIAGSELVRAYQVWADENRGYQLTDVNHASVRDLGDESWGWSANIVPDDEDETEGVWGLVAVRKGVFLQALAGWAVSGNVIASLGDIAEEGIDRWPSGGSSALHLPELNDYPEGMVIEMSFDITSQFPSKAGND